MKTLTKPKLISRLLFLIVFVFIVWNIVWAVNYNEYFKLSEDYKRNYKTVGKKIENYNCIVKRPDYFSLQGNFAISNNNLSLIIWPDLFISGNYTYGLRIYDDSLNHGYLFYVDHQLNYLDTSKNAFSNEEIKIINELLNKNSGELKKMNRLARKEWGI